MEALIFRPQEVSFDPSSLETVVVTHALEIHRLLVSAGYFSRPQFRKSVLFGVVQPNIRLTITLQEADARCLRFRVGFHDLSHLQVRSNGALPRIDTMEPLQAANQHLEVLSAKELGNYHL